MSGGNPVPEFIPGRELSGQFYARAVRPILDREFPGLPHSAALIGPGSDALGYDTPRSTDHDWGPRVLLFLQDDDASRFATQISTALAHQLPVEFLGFSTHFVREGDSRVARPIGTGPSNHQVKVGSLRGFLQSSLGLDPSDDLGPVDWLVTPEQGLLEVTAGPVFHDGLGQLTRLRAKLAYYPRDVWLYRLASQWRRLAQLEAFVGRTADVGDELGSRLIAASLVRDLMRLSFLQERTYAPYPKWFGSAFARLPGAAELGGLVSRVLAATSAPELEEHLVQACELVARRHNALGITAPLDPRASLFWDRPFRVIHGDRFADAIAASISDPDVKAIPSKLGAADQLSDSTDLLTNPAFFRGLALVYERERASPG
jgi:Domain of unknown function (DUF4037)